MLIIKNCLNPLAIIFIFCMTTSLSALGNESIIPQPQSIKWGGGAWTIPKITEACYSNKTLKSYKWLKQLVSGFTEMKLKKTNCEQNSWKLSLSNELSSLGPEGYKLEINSKGVIISAYRASGLFYGVQTLRQMLPASVEKGRGGSGISLTFVKIIDQPRFSWRGSMLDIARSFFDVDYIKQHIDRIALFKLNRLHLHLTDDQGWRIEIKKYPNLTIHGASGSVRFGRSGYLTQEDYKVIQSYASARNIIIIPEIDMPGHSYAALASYPELNCQDYTNIEPKHSLPPALYKGYKVKWNSLCLENKKVYEFVRDVLAEIAEITTGPWVHIGGDEVDRPQYADFISFADKVVNKLGKTTIGWEEILKADLSPSTIAQVWLKDSKPPGNVKKIMSPCTNFYLDHGNTKKQRIANNWCKPGGITIKDVYSFTIADDDSVLGIEAPIWTELVIWRRIADRKIWPRLVGVAEVAWTLEKNKNFMNFSKRLGMFGARFNNMGLRYYKTPEIKWSKGMRSRKPTSIFHNFMPL